MERKNRLQKKNTTTSAPKKKSIEFPVRINKYISNSGICSRRDADQLILDGKIEINGTVASELGMKVEENDEVKYNGKVIKPQNFVYVLLNKPKDYISTMEDPENRKTVMDLVKAACDERIYPVGRLDRNTTGLLLLTNDGAMSQKLTHPSYKIKKIYQVELDKPLTANHFEDIANGFNLEDGPVTVSDIAILDPSKKNIGVQIHIGKNRIVRRIFENFGYEVVKLDRTMYGSLTKKDLPRGKWRFLTDKEVILLKNMS
ncbi:MULTISPECIES: pseudouridine synthase [Reichenbachiella]|uniref:Pseudouridine synthase n=1 Tax=Reichenbachiella agariperforans TaxID=156994 RepID=A0A1M6P3N5_REIAG|nr:MULTISPECIES: pseudouridine synthase [Reichenbachiella]MBU2914684.1 rRNA pseudouridine synthase [Reichenbachiella agariperforans]RJE71607.1 pseudouridine synthase [Reichenbachiella sp. MSK19-1]SHK02516.1 23S rRNA pseudouridine2605 synthase [Reichenbachiella agariperforans]